MSSSPVRLRTSYRHYDHIYQGSTRICTGARFSPDGSVFMYNVTLVYIMIYGNKHCDSCIEKAQNG